MKKTILSAILSICFVSLLGLTGCANAMVNDGNNVKKYTSSVSGAEGGAVPFKTYNDQMDIQTWKDWDADCETFVQDGALVIQQTGAWYGIAICSDKAASDTNGAIYDLSNISKITFEAKADRTGTTMNFGPCTEDGIPYDLTEEYESFEYDMSNAKHAKTGEHYCIVSIVKDGADQVTHYIKNIAFYDASGNEVVPIVNE